MLVVDASVVVAALVDGGPVGTWAEQVVLTEPLAAPHLLPVEVANVLRRASDRGQISADVASLAHADLLDLSVEYFPYHLIAPRAWDLRSNVTVFDAWYVAVAELIEAPMATLDARLAAAPGPACPFLTPPA